MSKRGSRSSKFIGGKSWSTSSFRQSIKKGKSGLKKEKRKSKEFEAVREVFKLETTSPSYIKYHNEYLNIANKQIRKRVIDNLLNIEDRMKQDGRAFTIETYFNFQYHLRE
ncbi:hypothetical protein [Psychroserpens sp. Hel_I_66]|uniref:hypothetical protein n=1 Tax=Psychroserpens sp. Hel_I_66 TaxID=1250004 RepID=UPI000645E64D|nr:hypothetical protein [Psychroserpens sp. Hel_I_66]